MTEPTGHPPLDKGTYPEWDYVGPFDKPMRVAADGWRWLSFKGEVGPYPTREACEENICIHCGD